MPEEEPWQRLLRDALAVPALPPDEQVRINGPGCVARELLDDFDRTLAVEVGIAAVRGGPTGRLAQAALRGRTRRCTRPRWHVGFLSHDPPSRRGRWVWP
jgi:hypothetical protein